MTLKKLVKKEVRFELENFNFENFQDFVYGTKYNIATISNKHQHQTKKLKFATLLTLKTDYSRDLWNHSHIYIIVYMDLSFEIHITTDLNKYIVDK